MTRAHRLLAGAGLGLSLLGGLGCNTYHYFDVEVKFGSVDVEHAGVLQACQLEVSGEDTYSHLLPSSTVGDPKTVCPISNANWPTMGKFEYSTFADSGNLTFKVSGYKMLPVGPDNLCTSGTVTITASSAITQTGTLTMDSFDDAKCPTGIIRP